MYKSILILFLTLITQALSAQTNKDSLVNVYMNDLRTHLTNKEYNAANKDLGKLAALKTTLPDEVAFYYAVVQYQAGNRDKARAGFTKYLLLTGNTGGFSDSSHVYLKMIDCESLGYYEVDEDCRLCHATGELEIRCMLCEGTGKEYCSICNGNGVSIVHSAMGDRYQDCTTCKGTGLVLCSVCKGTLKRKTLCTSCHGKRFVKVRLRCND